MSSGPSSEPAWPAMSAVSESMPARPAGSSSGHSAIASWARARARAVRVDPRSDSATVRSSSWCGSPATSSASGTCSQSSRARSPRATAVDDARAVHRRLVPLDGRRERLVEHARAPPVVGDAGQLRDRPGAPDEGSLERPRVRGVQPAALARQQLRVHRLLDQRVPERVADVGDHEHLRLDRLADSSFLRLGPRRRW